MYHRLEDQNGHNYVHTRLVTDPDVGLVITPVMTQDTLLKVLRAREKTSKVDFQDMTWLEEDCLKEALSLCGESENLTLNRCANVTDRVLQVVGEMIPGLESLSMQNCPKVTIFGPTLALEGCRDLKVLDMSQNPNLISVPEENFDDDLIDLYDRALPPCLKSEVKIQTNHSIRDKREELEECVRGFVNALTSIELEELYLGDVIGVDDFLLSLFCGEEETEAIASWKESRKSKELEEKKRLEAKLEEERRAAATAKIEDEFTPSIFRRKSLEQSETKQSAEEEDDDDDEAAHETNDDEQESESKGEQIKSSLALPLRVLDISGCYKVKSHGLMHLAARCTNLEKLNLGMCCKIGNEGLQYLSDKCRKLRELDLSGLVLANDPSIELLMMRNGETLTHLNLSGCTSITNSSIGAIAKFGSRLQELHLTGCVNIEANCLFQLIDQCKQLKKVVLNACFQISQEQLQSLNTNKKIFHRLRERPVGDANVAGLVPNYRPLPSSQTLKAIAKDTKKKSAPKKKK